MAKAKVELRRFEFVSDTSNKFWEISVENCDLTTRWGRIDTEGQSKTKSFNTFDAAACEAEKLILQKTKKGYTAASGNNATTTEKTTVKKTAAKASVAKKPKVVERTLSLEDAKRLVWEFATEYDKSGYHQGQKPDKVPTGAQILNLPPVDQVEIVLACISEFRAVTEKTRYDTLRDLEERLLRRKLPYSSDDLEKLSTGLQLRLSGNTCHFMSTNASLIVNAIEKASKSVEITNVAKELLRKCRERFTDWRFSHEAGKLRARIDRIVGDADSRIPVVKGKAWADALIADLTAAKSANRTAWIHLLNHCVTAQAGAPDEKWNQAGAELLKGIKKSDFEQKLAAWIPLIDKANGRATQNKNRLKSLSESSQDILKGLTWCCAIRPSDSLAQTVTTAALLAFQKIPGIGPFSMRLGNACVVALGQMAEHGGASQLAILKVKVKQQNVRQLIEKQMAVLAEKMGLPAEQIEELSVPTYGLTDVGLQEEQLGDFTYRLEIESSSKLVWVKEDGKVQKSIPAAVKNEFANRLKELKETKKEIDKMLPVQRQRIENLYLQQCSWPFKDWSERYLNHLLVGSIVRRLIWQFQVKTKWVDGIFVEGKLVDLKNKTISKRDIKNVRPWHPIDHSTKTVLAWREFLASQQIKQPFKQAHREIYVLTAAERRTRIYSNRFAAHIIKQSQFRGLAPVRGWTTEFLGPWDGGDLGIAKRNVSAWDFTVQFWYNAALEDEYSDSYGWPYLSTDQVRYCRPNSEEAIPLADVPGIVFSEIMRDVDLFVGVCSVGNDPNWLDGGPRQEYADSRREFADYWNDYSFGNLSESANTRKSVIETLLPRLSIAGCCSLDGRFLVVKGKIRTYKIHLGSGNILMEPNDEYLCIVPKPAREIGNVFLPFEGDNTLSLILGKAFLLADDDQITDRTILSQIRI